MPYPINLTYNKVANETDGEKVWRQLYKNAANNIEQGACGVMVIVVGNGHGDTSSNPGRDCLHFT